MGAAWLCFFFCCSCGPSSDSSGPNDLEVGNALKQNFERQSRSGIGNPYFVICAGDLKKNILNREVQGKEAQVRVEVTWQSQMFKCTEQTDTFMMRFVNRDGKWEYAPE